MTLKQEIERRRTFAVISHPDAGKTTLTEKLLLYGGAKHLAGSVTARRKEQTTSSDWMELEKKRGISISSTLLQFDYEGYRVNLLDTPGHRDFSEDTYRVLTAVDSVIMVVDAAKGIESQTRKLFEICRRREIPIFTFINKMDRPTRHPLELIDEIEDTLQLNVFPVNWPLGTGFDFRGVYDRMARQVHLFEKTARGSQQATVSVSGLDDPLVAQKVDEASYREAREEVELLEAAGAEFNPQDVLDGDTTPIFFGSALNNFGVELLLKYFLKYAAMPAIYPDVSAIHVHEADIYGNCRARGITVSDFDVARASKRLIITCERLISNEEIRRDPSYTVIPYWCVDAVCEVPFGSYPGNMYGEYFSDEEHLRKWLKVEESPEELKKFLQKNIFSCKDHFEYIEKNGGMHKMQMLRQKEHMFIGARA